MNKYAQQQIQVQKTQVKLNTAFAAMRKLGLLAKQHFSCCGGCAGCELAIHVEALPEARRSHIKGAVFYTKQGGFKNNAKGTFLNFGPIETTKAGPIGLSTPEVGNLVVACLTQAGLSVDWDGNADTTIFVSTQPPVIHPLDRIDAALSGAQA